jgi:hydroxyacylglutathione hydrolase
MVLTRAHFRLLLPSLTFLVLALGACTTARNRPLVDLERVAWQHGAANCASQTDPAIQVVRYDAQTWILRQNKCLNYEAPFLFLLVGEQQALLLDTGATADSVTFPLYRTVRHLLQGWEAAHGHPLELVVAHTHNHGDHRAADAQFRGKPHVRLVGLDDGEVQQFFGLQAWPAQSAVLELGHRPLEIIPIPGHQAASIAVYDAATHLLFTGDTVYPGRLYVQDWSAFRASIQRLVTFAAHHKVAYVVGNHVEMSRTPGVDYPTGTTFQPDEHPLPLRVAELQQLNRDLQALGNQPTRRVEAAFIIEPK